MLKFIIFFFRMRLCLLASATTFLALVGFFAAAVHFNPTSFRQLFRLCTRDKPCSYIDCLLRVRMFPVIQTDSTYHWDCLYKLVNSMQ